MGDIRYRQALDRIRGAPDPMAALRAASDDSVIAALAAASAERDSYLANTLATEALNRLHRKDAMLDAIPEGLFTTDRAGLLTYLNPAVERKIGWTRAQILHQDVHALTHCRPAATREDAAVACAMMEAVRKGHTVHFPAVYRKPDGEDAYVGISAAPLMHHSEFRGAVVLLYDISHFHEGP